MYLKLGWKGGKAVPIEHPVFDGCKQRTEKEVDDLYAAGDMDKVIEAMRSCARYHVARMIGKWPSTEIFLDDMVSVAMVAVVETTKKYKGKRSFMKEASSRIVNALEVFLNSAQSVSAPCLTTQKKRVARGEEPIYIEAGDVFATDTAEGDPDTYKRDILEALSRVAVGKDEIDTFLLSRPAWGLANSEIGKMFGVSRQAIHKRRSKLFEEYLYLTR